jgi:hypothetical protein
MYCISTLLTHQTAILILLSQTSSHPCSRTEKYWEVISELHLASDYEKLQNSYIRQNSGNEVSGLHYVYLLLILVSSPSSCPVGDSGRDIEESTVEVNVGNIIIVITSTVNAKTVIHRTEILRVCSGTMYIHGCAELTANSMLR